ncbi:type I restriction enzyme HsdR N-terminal domain-containing protein [Bacillus paranthracis]|uniref:type I restriction enzyme HsdR N-terminal domain-containing protein n=1 Tax=Bacillus paranthracis TaxID=2026186 RepID=UPI002812E38A|nr:type I restriction enzyme HsdR N-terminal domain-containing protein [Bacillus paranthracis]MDR0170885.1 type I restriction enzyme HsdR N-terminal domain-containing protein [Bacillus paranthracis]
MSMKEADILHKVLYPIILETGFENDEIALEYLIKSNIGGGEIRVRPDIVLFKDKYDKTPLLVIELNPFISLSAEKLNNVVEKTLFYSNEIGVPIFAITDGISFYIYSRNKSLLAKIDSISEEEQRFKALLSKESLTGFIDEINKAEDKVASKVELEKEWLTKIDEEVLFLDNIDSELKYIGAKVVGYLGERVFEKFCLQQGITFRSVNLAPSFDFIVGSEKIEVKAILVDNKSKRYRFRYRQNSNSETTIVCIAIYVDLDDEALLGYNFKYAEVVGFAKADNLYKEGSTIRLIKPSDLSPIDKWIEGLKGGVQ